MKSKKFRTLKYGCGHVALAELVVSVDLSFVDWFRWRDSTGFNGSREECFDCFLVRLREESRKIRRVRRVCFECDRSFVAMVNVDDALCLCCIKGV